MPASVAPFSRRTEPVAPLTAPSADPRWAELAAHYAEHGYAIARQAITGPTLTGLTAEFDRTVTQIVTPSDAANARWDSSVNDELDPERKTVVVYTHQIHQYSSSWAKICFDDRFLDPCAALLGPDVILHHTKLFMKPAGIGAPFPPHQDWSYFPANDDRMLAAVVAISDCNEDNGCIRVWPGSHKLGRLDASNGGRGLDGNGSFAQRFPFSASVPAILAPGDILFFHYLTVHGSLPNFGTQPRKSVLFQLHSGSDTLDNSLNHPNSQLVLRGWHHVMDREHVR